MNKFKQIDLFKSTFLILFLIGLLYTITYESSIVYPSLSIEIGDPLPVEENSLQWIKKNKKNLYLNHTDKNVQARLTTEDKAKIINKNGIDYLPVGEYKITIDDLVGEVITNTIETTLIIKDTTAPTVSKQSKEPLTVFENTNLFNISWTDYLIIDDFTPYEVKISTTNYSDEILKSVKRGSYNIKLDITDSCKNKTTIDYQINVISDQNQDSIPQPIDEQPADNPITNVPSSSVIESPQPNPPVQSEIPDSSRPACEPVPPGSFLDFSEAASAAQAELDSILNSGQWDMGRYVVDTHLTNCGVWYYTYQVLPF